MQRQGFPRRGFLHMRAFNLFGCKLVLLGLAVPFLQQGLVRASAARDQFRLGLVLSPSAKPAELYQTRQIVGHVFCVSRGSEQWDRRLAHGLFASGIMEKFTWRESVSKHRLRGGGEGHARRVETFGKEQQSDPSRRKALELAKNLRYAAERGHEAEVGALLDQGAEVNVRDCAGFTPLHLCAERGFQDTIAILVQRGAAVDAREDITGRTALHIAAHEGRESAVESLIASGADLEARDHVGSTPFLVAARTGKLATMKLLAKHGCDATVSDSHGEDATRLVEGNTRLKPETRQELLDYLAALRQD